jgi:hypothetical protein
VQIDEEIFVFCWNDVNNRAAKIASLASQHNVVNINIPSKEVPTYEKGIQTTSVGTDSGTSPGIKVSGPGKRAATATVSVTPATTTEENRDVSDEQTKRKNMILRPLIMCFEMGLIKFLFYLRASEY